jgi:hypothetical protein
MKKHFHSDRPSDLARRNPRVGLHPDLFGGESAIVTDVRGMSEAEIKQLPRDAFDDAEFAHLDEHLQEYIHEHDPASKARIDQLVEAFVSRHKWLEEPDEQYLSNQFDDDWDNEFGEYADDFVDMARRSYRDQDHVAEIFNEFRPQSDDAEIEAALLEAMQDNNNWDFTYGTNEYGEAFLKTSSNQSFYIEADEIDALTEHMHPDEIAVALAEINHATYLSLKPEDLEQQKYALEIDGYVTYWSDANPDWEKLSAAVAQTLGIDALADEAEEVVALPPEARVLHTFPDKFFVLDLTPEELPAESKAMGMCVGDPRYRYAQEVRAGRTKILSLRRPSGKPLFTIEALVGPGRLINEIVQIKGKANRLPGWDLGKVGFDYALKTDEVKKVIELVETLGIDPETVEDLKPALQRLRGLPPRENPRRRNAEGHCGFCCPR